MKTAYPVIFTKLDDGFAAHAPDFPLDTQGDDYFEAIVMVRDAIGIIGIDMEDDGKPLPTPSDPQIIMRMENEIVSMVDIDFIEYRKNNDRYTALFPVWRSSEAS